MGTDGIDTQGRFRRGRRTFIPPSLPALVFFSSFPKSSIAYPSDYFRMTRISQLLNPKTSGNPRGLLKRILKKYHSQPSQDSVTVATLERIAGALIERWYGWQARSRDSSGNRVLVSFVQTKAAKWKAKWMKNWTTLRNPKPKERRPSWTRRFRWAACSRCWRAGCSPASWTPSTASTSSQVLRLSDSAAPPETPTPRFKEY